MSDEKRLAFVFTWVVAVLSC